MIDVVVLDVKNSDEGFSEIIIDVQHKETERLVTSVSFRVRTPLQLCNKNENNTEIDVAEYSSTVISTCLAGQLAILKNIFINNFLVSRYENFDGLGNRLEVHGKSFERFNINVYIYNITRDHQLRYVIQLKTNVNFVMIYSFTLVFQEETFHYKNYIIAGATLLVLFFLSILLGCFLKRTKCSRCSSKSEDIQVQLPQMQYEQSMTYRDCITLQNNQVIDENRLYALQNQYLSPHENTYDSLQI